MGIESVNGQPTSNALPYAYVVQVMWRELGGMVEKHYGPFEDEPQAMQWVAENIPDRTLFAVLGLYRNV